ncbi:MULTISPECIES: TetR/AcrR family transcriptional regulator [Lysinibacillus]|uniref:TetR/AcrR family transcriptional regulator n=1 Tax=Lysinibacillus TaxID=400634 RepID=UPI0006CEA62F|nr:MULTISPECIES: TetR/AcrR family transcriptional regulator [Lysinibacillus]KPN97494.1 TetR family transcriptional regulator [Lysinibacillus sp. ZYM-1]MCK1988221.1 TetR/AcrR family transcriptional regulator [Lysinibacillus fusiformis]MCR8853663.1 TetR/AcrR family transcriptional regulator [Lysinibacillus fusiformis]WKT79513.1 TetR/AcrR family transcriptional regulator [Lysinibacillus fusiformis]
MARNKEFDEKAVLKKAMELFWKQGYEKTSMQDLVNHMGIHRRSIYDTFGDKYSLFLASLKSYEVFVAEELTKIISNSSTLKIAIRNIFEYVVNLAELEIYPAGCFAVNTAVELSLLDKDIQHLTTKMFNDTEELFNKLLKEGQNKGELKNDLNTQVTAQFLHNNLIGLRVLVKTKYTKKDLESIIDLILKVLE